MAAVPLDAIKGAVMWGGVGRVPGLFQLLVAASIPWLVSASLQSRPLSSHNFFLSVFSSSVCTQLPVALFYEAHVIARRACMDYPGKAPPEKILNLTTSFGK